MQNKYNHPIIILIYRYINMGRLFSNLSSKPQETEIIEPPVKKSISVDKTNTGTVKKDKSNEKDNKAEKNTTNDTKVTETKTGKSSVKTGKDAEKILASDMAKLDKEIGKTEFDIEHKKKDKPKFSQRFFNKVDDCSGGDKNKCKEVADYCIDFSFSNLCINPHVVNTIKKQKGTLIKCNEDGGTCSKIDQIVVYYNKNNEFNKHKVTCITGEPESSCDKIKGFCSSGKFEKCDNLEKVMQTRKEYQEFVKLHDKCSKTKQCDDVKKFCDREKNLVVGSCRKRGYYDN